MVLLERAGKRRGAVGGRAKVSHHDTSVHRFDFPGCCLPQRVKIYRDSAAGIDPIRLIRIDSPSRYGVLENHVSELINIVFHQMGWR